MLVSQRPLAPSGSRVTDAKSPTCARRSSVNALIQLWARWFEFSDEVTPEPFYWVKNTTVFDKAGRTTSITATNTAGTVLSKRAYTYTVGATGKDGQLRKTMTTETGAVSTYTYDGMKRLTQTVTGTITEAWTYDANGNRLTAAKTGATTVRSAYNGADQLCWTSTGTGTCAAPPTGATLYTYDANGNQTNAGGTRPSTWNTFDQLTKHNTTSFTYAGLGNTERLTSGSTSFLNGSLGITQQTNGSGTASFIRDPEGTLISMRNSAGASYYYTTDALGSTILLTDSAQAKAATYLYDSWGNTSTQTGTQAAVNPWRFAGGYKDDATGYTKFGARYYAPGLGRFNQPDPSGQEANAYLYAEANPCNRIDPSGLASAACWIGAGATLLAGAAFIATGGITLAAYAYGVAIFASEIAFAGAGFSLFTMTYGLSKLCE